MRELWSFENRRVKFMYVLKLRLYSKNKISGHLKLYFALGLF